MSRYCATSRTSKHRFFVFCDNETLPETKVLIIALSDAYHLGVLNSRFHVAYSEVAGGRLGVGNDPTYNHTECFDTFPFPLDVAPALMESIREEAEALDSTRKQVLRANPDLGLTDIYNVLQAMREGRALTAEERDIHDRGLATVILKHHVEIDRFVAQAYGWPEDLSEEEALARLVDLNKSLAAEEKRGTVRWLRPEYQAPHELVGVSGSLDLGESRSAAAPTSATPWPSTLPDQVTAISKILALSARPMSSIEVARIFKGKRASTVEPVLDALAAVGQARRLSDGRYAP